MKIRDLLEIKAPQIEVTGLQHADSESGSLFAKCMMGMVGIFVIILLIGDKICTMTGQPVHYIIKNLQASMMIQIPMIIVVICLIYPAFEAGAFEVYINRELKFSKLRTLRMMEDYDIRAIFTPYY